MENDWISSSSGDYTTNADWSLGSYSGLGGGGGFQNSDDVVIDIAPASGELVVTLDTPNSYQLNSLTLGSSSITNDELYVDTEANSDGTTQILLNASLTNYGTLYVNDSFLTFNGAATITNSGTIDLFGSDSLLQLSGATTLTGGGHVNMSGSINGFGAETFENVNNTIGGTGGIYGVTLTNDTGGTIAASGGTLTLHTGQTIVNNGLLEADYASSTLTIDDNVQNTDGEIRAQASQASVLFNNNLITGGDVLAEDNGFLQSNGATFDGISIDGTLQLSSGNASIFEDTITAGAVSLTGSGSLFLLGADIIASTPGQGLNDGDMTNASFIYGYGQIGDGVLLLGNSGTIESDDANLILALSDINNGTSVNDATGTLTALTGSELAIDAGDTSGSDFTNNGTLDANGGTVVIGANVAVTNYNASVPGSQLTGGTYEAVGSGATVSLNRSFTSIKAATVILNGVGSVIEVNNQQGSGNVKLETLLTDIAAGAALEVLGGRSYSTTNAITNEGSLIVGGAFGSGALTSSGAIAGRGTATITSTLTQTGGTIGASSASFLTLTGKDTLNGTTNNLGQTILSNNTFSLGKSFAVTAGTWTWNNATVVINPTALSFAGIFNETSSIFSFAAAGSTMTLSGAAALHGGDIASADTLSITGTATAIGFTVSGGGTLSDAKVVNVTGPLVLGSAGGNASAGTLAVRAGALLYLADGGSIVPSGSKGVLTNAGTIEKVFGTQTSTIGLAFANGGALRAQSGTLDLVGAVSGTGTGTIATGGTLEFDAAVASTQKVAFGIGGGKLALYAAPSFAGSISAFGAGDSVDVFNFGTGTTLTYTANAQNTGGTLAVVNGASRANLTLVGAYAASGFTKTSTSSDTLIKYTAPAAAATKMAAASVEPTSSGHDSFAQALFAAAFEPAPFGADQRASLFDPQPTLAVTGNHDVTLPGAPTGHGVF